LSVPPLSKAFKPYLGEAIFVMLTVRIFASESEGGPIAAATVWVMLIVPLMLGAVFLRRRPSRSRSLFQFPIYLQPHLLKPLARRISAKR